MNPTKTARYAAAALVVPALLFTAACGSDSKDDDAPKSGAVGKVSGKFGSEPKIEVPKGAKAADDIVVKDVSTGDGAEVKKGDIVRLDFAGNLEALGSTWAQRQNAETKGPRAQVVQEVGQQGQMLPPRSRTRWPATSGALQSCGRRHARVRGRLRSTAPSNPASPSTRPPSSP
ncbi:hypothetical protein SCALM49S_08313 [Streptomyces californicus]